MAYLFRRFSDMTTAVSTKAILIRSFGSVALMIQEYIIEFTIFHSLYSVESSPSFKYGRFRVPSMNPFLFLDLKPVLTTC